MWFDGTDWNWDITFYYCDGDSGDDYGGMIDQGYWEFPCGQHFMSAVDSLRNQYLDPTLYDSLKFGSDTGYGQVALSQRSGVHYVPPCTDFVTNVAAPEFFTWRI